MNSDDSPGTTSPRHLDRIEIRMLGRFFVRRSNGEVVDGDEWNTGKTADLLRLLALSANRPVSVQSITGTLWPDVDENKARASLRTAASRVRQVMGEPCIERHLGGLVLRNAWTDVGAFTAITHDAAAALRAGDRARVVTLAREAEALYVDDFRAYDDKSSWATETRESLRLSRQSLLADAGESAVMLKWMRDAIDFSTLAIAGDSCFERPHRTLMRAHAALGEIDLALRAFEHCRAALAQELGADPSPQTRALHLEILSGDAPDMTVQPFAGRDEEVEVLSADLRSALEGGGCDVVLLAGPPGSGRGALLTEAATRVRQAHLRFLHQDESPEANAAIWASMASDRRSDVVVWGPCDGAPAREVTWMTAVLSDLDANARVIVIITSTETAGLLVDALFESPVSLHLTTTGPIGEDDLAALAAAALSGPASPQLLRELGEHSGWLAGRAVSVLRTWLAAGWIISTLDGLDLYDEAASMAGAGPVGDHFRVTFEQLSREDRELCHVLALLDRPASATLLNRLTSIDRSVEDLQLQLDELSDLGVLRARSEGYVFRNQALRDAFELYLRPAAKSRARRSIDRDLGGETAG